MIFIRRPCICSSLAESVLPSEVEGCFCGAPPHCSSSSIGLSGVAKAVDVRLGSSRKSSFSHIGGEPGEVSDAKAGGSEAPGDSLGIFGAWLTFLAGTDRCHQYCLVEAYLVWRSCFCGVTGVGIAVCLCWRHADSWISCSDPLWLVDNSLVDFGRVETIFPQDLSGRANGKYTKCIAMSYQ